MNWSLNNLILSIVAVFFCYTSVLAKPNDMWNERNVKDAYELLEAIANRDINKVHSMLDESFHVYQGTSSSFKKLSDKKVFAAQFDRIFNDHFIKALKANLKKELNVAGAAWYGRSRWFVKLNQGNAYDEYAVIFNEGGRALAINNPTMIVPSFNCLLARSKTEKSLCNNLKLSKLDVAVSNSYKNGKRYLTGSEYTSLKSEQRKFNKVRNKCGDSVDCLELTLSNRNNEITKLIDNERNKTPEPFKDNAQLAGTWKNERWINAANCESNSDLENKANTKLTITYKHPYVLMSKEDKFENSRLVCKVKSSSTVTFKKIEDENGGKFDWGTCRGSIDKLNFRGNYTYMSLEKIDSVGKTDECENSMLIISGHNGNYQMIYDVDAKYLTKNGLASSGFLMKREQ